MRLKDVCYLPPSQIPFGDSERLSQFPGLQPQLLSITGAGWKSSAADVVLSSAGWVAVTVGQVSNQNYFHSTSYAVMYTILSSGGVSNGTHTWWAWRALSPALPVAQCRHCTRQEVTKAWPQGHLHWEMTYHNMHMIKLWILSPPYYNTSDSITSSELGPWCIHK